MIRDGRIGKVKKVTCGIGGATASPVLPVVDVPEGLDWDQWLGPAPKVPYRALPKCVQVMEVAYRFTPTATTHGVIGTVFGRQMNDWGAHHVDIATWALGADETGPIHP